MKWHAGNVYVLPLCWHRGLGHLSGRTLHPVLRICGPALVVSAQPAAVQVI